MATAVESWGAPGDTWVCVEECVQLSVQALLMGSVAGCGVHRAAMVGLHVRGLLMGLRVGAACCTEVEE